MKTALIFGSSGLIGNHLLNCILKDDYYQKIKLFIRTKIDIGDPRVEVIYDDFKNTDNLEKTINYSTKKTISCVSKLTPASVLAFAISGSCIASCIFSIDSTSKTW